VGPVKRRHRIPNTVAVKTVFSGVDRERGGKNRSTPINSRRSGWRRLLWTLQKSGRTASTTVQAFACAWQKSRPWERDSRHRTQPFDELAPKRPICDSHCFNDDFAAGAASRKP